MQETSFIGGTKFLAKRLLYIQPFVLMYQQGRHGAPDSTHLQMATPSIQKYFPVCVVQLGLHQ